MTPSHSPVNTCGSDATACPSTPPSLQTLVPRVCMWPQGPEASEAPEHRCGGGAGEPGAGAGAGKGVSTPGSTTPWGSGSPPLRAPGEARQGNAGRGLGAPAVVSQDQKSGVYLALGVRGDQEVQATSREAPEVGRGRLCSSSSPLWPCPWTTGPNSCALRARPARRSSCRHQSEAWADFRGGGRPLLGEAAELEDDEALEALAPSSPLMYPSPASALSPALGARCPGELPRLAELGGPLGLHGGGSGGGSAGLPEALLDGSQDAYGPRARAGTPAYFGGCKGGAYGGGGGFGPPALGALRRLPMQTIQENKQASFAPAAAPYRPGALPALLPPPPPAPRPGPLLGAPGELALAGAAATYPGKGVAPYAPPAPSRSALAHPISLMTLPGEAGATGLAPPGHAAVFGGPPGGLLLDALPGPYAAAAAGPLGAAPDRFPADLDLDIPSSSTTSWTATKWTSTSTRPCRRRRLAWPGPRPPTRAGCQAEGRLPRAPGALPRPPGASEAAPTQLETALRS
ncbi:hypothetical protein FD755_002315 [Muntiacus reevesi]|uniref:FOXO protein KIX-binding domain-containing protein n=1 Tax=Muntiacus reevesi TaxID=9886 RepID=A0A5J5N6W5_MUNRE|nr:hypothetical protein FD755_002315 [Muntiacus reevesi]